MKLSDEIHTHVYYSDTDLNQVAGEHEQVKDTLSCTNCQTTLGLVDAGSEGWRIWKWRIKIVSGSPAIIKTYGVQKWISARLLFLIENHVVRKFHIHPEVDSAQDTSVPSLLIWVFTPDMFYSSSILSKERQDPTRSMKIFYRRQTYAQPKPGEAESATIEEVVFPTDLYNELSSTLEQSQRILPASARKFQGWEVGLLERFNVDDDRVFGGDEADNSVKE
jgi:ubiquitin-protein ligase E3 D